jgi:hypothetical protein
MTSLDFCDTWLLPMRVLILLSIGQFLTCVDISQDEKSPAVIKDQIASRLVGP